MKPWNPRRRWSLRLRRHPSPASWTDFVRGAAAPRDRAVMEEHRRECRPCARLERALRLVAEAAQSERAEEPRASTVRLATSIPAVRSFDSFRGSRVELGVSFDSLSAAPATMGVRSAEAECSRDLIFTSPDYSVSLSLSRDEPDGCCTVIGEVVRDDGEPIPDVWVQGRRDDGRVAHGRTAGNGDFTLASGGKPPAELLLLDGSRLLRLRIPGSPPCGD